MNAADFIFEDLRAVLDSHLPPALPATLLLALSGGRDSSVLLHLMCDYVRERSRLTLMAVHVNHGIRGEEAHRDEAFCVSLCDRLGVPLTVRRLDVPAYASERQMGMEEAARVLRYAALREVAGKANSPCYILTAHHATDQVETVLMHLIRGAGPEGMGGMQEKNRDILRPLLHVSAERIAAYAEERGIPFVTDSTNADLTCTRNYIRHELLPRLYRLNPALDETVDRTARNLRSDGAYLAGLAEGHSIREGASVLAALPDPILSRVLLRAHRDAFPDAPMLTRDAVCAMTAAIRSEKPYVELHIPGGYFLKDRERLLMRNRVLCASRCVPSLPLQEGWQEFDGGESMFLLKTGKLSGEDEEKIAFYKNIYNLFSNVTLNSDKIIGGLFVRLRKEGDSYHDGRHTRDIRKLLQSAKYPLTLRTHFPLICHGERVVYLPTFPADATYLARGEGVRLFCFLDRKEGH